MTRLEKLLKIREGYEALIPCVKNNVVQDYGLVLAVAPALLTELINEEKQSVIEPSAVKPAFEWSLGLIKKINALKIDESLVLPDGRMITCRKFLPETESTAGSICGDCAIVKLGLGQFCNMFYCEPNVRCDRNRVYFELTKAPHVDNSAPVKKEESNA